MGTKAMSGREWYFSHTAITSALVLGFANSAWAADPGEIEPTADLFTPPTDLPAVSGFNAKISPYFGWQDDDAGDGALIGIDGTVAFPLSHRFGAEIGGQFSGVDGDLFGRAQGHVFWRNPSTGLLGVYGSVEGFDDYDYSSWRLAGEAEAYFDQVTLAGLLGYEDQDTPSGSDNGVFALADINYYLTDDLRLSVGYRHMFGMDMAAAGFEYQLSDPFLGSGTSLFAEARIGDDDYAAVWGGLRLYFGTGQKSLIRRHREDDLLRPDERPRIRMDDCGDDKFDKCNGREET